MLKLPTLIPTSNIPPVATPNQPERAPQELQQAGLASSSSLVSESSQASQQKSQPHGLAEAVKKNPALAHLKPLIAEQTMKRDYKQNIRRIYQAPVEANAKVASEAALKAALEAAIQSRKDIADIAVNAAIQAVEKDVGFPLCREIGQIVAEAVAKNRALAHLKPLIAEQTMQRDYKQNIRRIYQAPVEANAKVASEAALKAALEAAIQSRKDIADIAVNAAIQAVEKDVGFPLCREIGQIVAEAVNQAVEQGATGGSPQEIEERIRKQTGGPIKDLIEAKIEAQTKEMLDASWLADSRRREIYEYQQQQTEQPIKENPALTNEEKKSALRNSRKQLQHDLNKLFQPRITPAGEPNGRPLIFTEVTEETDNIRSFHSSTPLTCEGLGIDGAISSNESFKNIDVNAPLIKSDFMVDKDDLPILIKKLEHSPAAFHVIGLPRAKMRTYIFFAKMNEQGSKDWCMLTKTGHTIEAGERKILLHTLQHHINDVGGSAPIAVMSAPGSAPVHSLLPDILDKKQLDICGKQLDKIGYPCLPQTRYSLSITFLKALRDMGYTIKHWGESSMHENLTQHLQDAEIKSQWANGEFDKKITGAKLLRCQGEWMVWPEHNDEVGYSLTHDGVFFQGPPSAFYKTLVQKESMLSFLDMIYVAPSNDANIMHALTGIPRGEAQKQLGIYAADNGIPAGEELNFAELSEAICGLHPNPHVLPVIYDPTTLDDDDVERFGETLNGINGNFAMENNGSLLCFTTPDASDPSSAQAYSCSDPFDYRPESRVPSEEWKTTLQDEDCGQEEIGFLFTSPLHTHENMPKTNWDTLPDELKEVVSDGVSALEFICDQPGSPQDFFEHLVRNYAHVPLLTLPVFARYLEEKNALRPEEEKMEITLELNREGQKSLRLHLGEDPAGCLVQYRDGAGLLCTINFGKIGGKTVYLNAEGEKFSFSQIDEESKDEYWHAVGPVRILRLKGKGVLPLKDMPSNIPKANWDTLPGKVKEVVSDGVSALKFICDKPGSPQEFFEHLVRNYAYIPLLTLRVFAKYLEEKNALRPEEEKMEITLELNREGQKSLKRQLGENPSGCLVQYRDGAGLRTIKFGKIEGKTVYLNAEEDKFSFSQIDEESKDEDWHAVGPVRILRLKGKGVLPLKDMPSNMPKSNWNTLPDDVKKVVSNGVSALEFICAQPRSPQEFFEHLVRNYANIPLLTLRAFAKYLEETKANWDTLPDEVKGVVSDGVSALEFICDQPGSPEEFFEHLVRNYGHVPLLTLRVFARYLEEKNALRPEEEKMEITLESNREGQQSLMLQLGENPSGCLVQYRDVNGLLCTIKFGKSEGKTAYLNENVEEKNKSFFSQIDKDSEEERWHAVGPVRILRLKGKGVLPLKDIPSDESDLESHFSGLLSPNPIINKRTRSTLSSAGNSARSSRYASPARSARFSPAPTGHKRRKPE